MSYIFHHLLTSLGLSFTRHSPFPQDLPPNALPGRVIINHGNHAEIAVAMPEGSEQQTVMLSSAFDVTPVAGDWVLISQGALTEVMPRYTQLVRPAVDGHGVQVLAANIDTVLLVVLLEVSPSLKAVEKLLIMGWDSGANRVLVLTKTDLCNNLAAELERIEAVSMGIPIFCISTKTGEGLDEVARLVSNGTTTMLGASGAGKTTLLNALEGTDEPTQQVRRDGQGRHTTTSRKLFMLNGGGVILDVPGIRSLTVGADDDAVRETFAEITALAEQCRFTDCSHNGDFGCAVEAAVNDGTLPERRLESWRQVQRELDYQRRKQDPALWAEQKKMWKQQTKQHRKR